MSVSRGSTALGPIFILQLVPTCSICIYGCRSSKTFCKCNRSRGGGGGGGGGKFPLCKLETKTLYVKINQDTQRGKTHHIPQQKVRMQVLQLARSHFKLKKKTACWVLLRNHDRRKAFEIKSKTHDLLLRAGFDTSINW